MSKGLVAEVSSEMDAPVARVWDALVNPAAIRQYMFGTNMVSDWNVGSPIVWKGEWQGKPYEDKGTILKKVEGQTIQYSHFSPLSGQPDVPENYHTVTIELAGDGAQTVVSLSQDNNATEEDRQHSEQNWKMMLDRLKQYIER